LPVTVWRIAGRTNLRKAGAGAPVVSSDSGNADLSSRTEQAQPAGDRRLGIDHPAVHQSAQAAIVPETPASSSLDPGRPGRPGAREMVGTMQDTSPRSAASRKVPPRNRHCLQTNILALFGNGKRRKRRVL
jgi:hypothetical protein